MLAQSKGARTEALHYYHFLHLETDPYDNSHVYYHRGISVFIHEMENMQKP